MSFESVFPSVRLYRDVMFGDLEMLGKNSFISSPRIVSIINNKLCLVNAHVI